MIEIGVVLAGGTGSRLLPLTKVLNKHILPVNGQPMLHWPLRTLAKLGVERAVVVLGGQSCGEVIEHFGTRYDTGDGVLSLVYVYQEGAGGIGAALGCALPALEAMRADRAVVVLGDNVFPEVPPALRARMDSEWPGEAFVVAKRVQDASSYGCVVLSDAAIPVPDSLVEKPKAPPPDGCSYAALLGLYVLPVAGVRIRLPRLVPSARGEVEVVDLLAEFGRLGDLSIHLTTQAWIDAGDPPGYRLANDPAFWMSRSDLAGLADRASS